MSTQIRHAVQASDKQLRSAGENVMRAAWSRVSVKTHLCKKYRPLSCTTQATRMSNITTGAAAAVDLGSPIVSAAQAASGCCFHRCDRAAFQPGMRRSAALLGFPIQVTQCQEAKFLDQIPGASCCRQRARRQIAEARRSSINVRL